MKKAQPLNPLLQSLLVIMGCIGAVVLSLYEIGLLGSVLALFRHH